MEDKLRAEIEQMIAEAVKVRENAHHNHFKVGAVLKMHSGKIYTGCNVANGGIQSICAERVAFVKAISEGEREFESIAIVGGQTNSELEECLPCGYCRQFISEFVDENFKIYTQKDEQINEYTLEELLPHRFKL